MKLEVDFRALKEAVRRMGAEPVSFDIHVDLAPPDPIDTQLSDRGIELTDPDAVDRSRGLLSYEGRQILLYIRNHDGKVEQALENGQKGNKFHVADCKTLESMRNRGRFERYVVTNRLDGWFHIEGRNWQTRLQEEGDARLWVCQNCLKKLNYKGAANDGARDVARTFDIEGFFATYSSFFKHLPKRRADDAAGEDYTPDWGRISGEFKAAKNYVCDECGVDLSENKNLLHVHHRNGVKSDNDPGNLRSLCASCHREQPSHGHMFVRHEDTRKITSLRREQRLLKRGDWDKVFQLCDPALHGALDACKQAGILPPEVGCEVTNAKGAVIAELEAGWPKRKLGIAIGDEDKRAAEVEGWKVFDHISVIEDPEWVLRGLKQ